MIVSTLHSLVFDYMGEQNALNLLSTEFVHSRKNIYLDCIKQSAVLASHYKSASFAQYIEKSEIRILNIYLTIFLYLMNK